ncbi:MAG: M24 family metallopeptidase, partial [bacterium]|nr:M24 family metallopeptidase [bacterium]
MSPKKRQGKNPNTRLIIAASEADANLYWATGFLAPDPIVFIEHRKRKYLILNDLELDRGRKEAKVDRVLALSKLEKSMKRINGRSNGLLDVVAHFLKQKKTRSIAVPYDFPIAYAEGLKKRKIRATPLKDPFYPKRLIKTRQEKNAIRQTLKHISAAIQEAYRVLRESKIRGNRIYWRKQVLTSEVLKRVINGHLMENNCLGKHTIVAGGEQGVDPHCEGSGPLRPHRPIIMDVFPKSMDSQYYGDMTRTVVKGKASEKFKKQWQAVKKA